MAFKFHFLDAYNECPCDLWQSMKNELEAARDTILTILPTANLDVVVAPNTWVIPELGINGFAHGRGRLTLSVDPESPRILDRERGMRLRAILAHELFHIHRIRAHGSRRSLGECLVEEGLAQCFEEEVGAPTPGYAIALDDIQLTTATKRARPLLNAIEFDHGAWMFGRRGDPEWPRHLGYSLGYAITKNWLAGEDLKVSAAIDVDSNEILAAWF